MQAQRVCFKHHVRRSLHDLIALGPPPRKCICKPSCSCVPAVVLRRRHTVNASRRRKIRKHSPAPKHSQVSDRMLLPAACAREIVSKRWKHGALKPKLHRFRIRSKTSMLPSRPRLLLHQESSSSVAYSAMMIQWVRYDIVLWLSACTIRDRCSGYCGIQIQHNLSFVVVVSAACAFMVSFMSTLRPAHKVFILFRSMPCGWSFWSCSTWGRGFSAVRKKMIKSCFHNHVLSHR